MKKPITLLITLTLSLVVYLAASAPRAYAAPPQRFHADSGILTPAVGEVLRITVNGAAGNDAITFRFAWARYMPAGCNNDNVCRHVIQSQGATAPVMLAGTDAVSYDVQGNGNAVRVVVETNSRDTHVLVQILNQQGEVVACAYPLCGGYY